jgi:hypothetical protein
LDPEDLEGSSCHSLLRAGHKLYESPKREVETQTQGEHKSTQYELEDLLEFAGEFCSRERLEFLLGARFGSPRREVEVQTEQECKAVQCVSEDLEASGEFGPFFRRQTSFGSPRREVQVQTGQDTKATQYDPRETGEPRLRRQVSLDDSEPCDHQEERFDVLLKILARVLDRSLRRYQESVSGSSEIRLFQSEITAFQDSQGAFLP